MMSPLVMVLPDKTSPGFLRRTKAAVEFQVRLRAEVPDTKLFDDMVEFLLPFVKEPENRDEARTMLWDASQEQFEQAMEALVGGSKATVPPTSTTT